ncbi:hypothetical protein PVAND_008366 [Polypedilum vanderplanki]|uniref:Uncharacterized protein n=1 Tax=Polypedilum vanderplanki TaxID=319348 RepID=A0A9J6CAT8_POLVA|nr:hypothetical protein PVAND_008366 [Polypedilum vanderplanki]
MSCSQVRFLKFCGFLSVIRNTLWIAFIMILWSLINQKHEYAIFCRVGLKLFEFYILWSSYAAVKLFEALRKMKSSKLSYFHIDCILSTLTDFIALSIFIHQYLFYRKGFEFIVVFICLLLINLTLLISVRLVKTQIERDILAQQNLHSIMMGDVCENSNSFDSWTRKIVRPAEYNYSFKMVIDEINSIYRERDS